MSTDKHTPDLLPCPFCGGEASDAGTVKYSAQMVSAQEWDQSTFFFCNCPSCGVSNIGLVGHTTVEAARSAWNRRAALASAGQPS